MKHLSELCRLPADSTLLIIHADDLGMSRSATAATMDAFADGAISSASIIVPSPTFDEAARVAANAPAAWDIGVHLAITSEWPICKWGPVSGSGRGSGMADDSGCFPASIDEIRDIDLPALERELTAQVNRCLQAGLAPTHVDSHMYALFIRPDLFGVYLQVARRFGLTPAVVPEMREDPAFAQLLAESELVLDAVFQADPSVHPADWLDFYQSVLYSLRPGLNQLIVHPGYDTPEMRAVTGDRECWGAAWRQRDFDVLTSCEFKSVLREKGIHLVGWGHAAAAVANQRGAHV